MAVRGERSCVGLSSRGNAPAFGKSVSAAASAGWVRHHGVERRRVPLRTSITGVFLSRPSSWRVRAV